MFFLETGYLFIKENIYHKIRHPFSDKREEDLTDKKFRNLWRSTWRMRGEFNDRDQSLLPFYVKIFWSRRSTTLATVKNKKESQYSIRSVYFRIYQESRNNSL